MLVILSLAGFPLSQAQARALGGGFGKVFTGIDVIVNLIALTIFYSRKACESDLEGYALTLASAAKIVRKEIIRAFQDGVGPLQRASNVC